MSLVQIPVTKSSSPARQAFNPQKKQQSGRIMDSNQGERAVPTDVFKQCTIKRFYQTLQHVSLWNSQYAWILYPRESNTGMQPVMLLLATRAFHVVKLFFGAD